MVNVVAPFGFYGWGNIGDESTLQGFARLVSCYRPQIRVWVASRNPSHTARVEPSFKYYKAVGQDLRRHWAHYRSEALVVPGGTPIMDVLGAWPLNEVVPLVQAGYTQGKPVIFIGTGTENLLREESKRIVSEILATSVQHWTVRCQRDKDRLTEYGVLADRITVAADLAWTLNPVDNQFGRECLAQWGLNLDRSFVGVNINNEHFVLQQEPRLCEKLGVFLDEVVEKSGASILFFCNEVRDSETFDRAANLKVLSYMTHRDNAFLVPNHYWTPQQMLSLIGCCRITVGIRYHFCLFSALQGIPFVALKRSAKIDDLCWDMNWPYGLCLKELNTSILSDMISDIDREQLSLRNSLKEKTQLMQVRAERNSIGLNVLSRLSEV
jgi:polysaccharide pyruvyl transferase WcaK-like protein